MNAINSFLLGMHVLLLSSDGIIFPVSFDKSMQAMTFWHF